MVVSTCRYGGVYVDSDVVVMKPLKSLDSSVGLEHLQSKMPSLNGAVMAFQNHRSTTGSLLKKNLSLIYMNDGSNIFCAMDSSSASSSPS